MTGRHAFALAASATVALTGTAPVSSAGIGNRAPVALDLTLEPELHAGGRATGLDVSYRLEGLDPAPDGRVAFAAETLAPFGRTTDRITDLSASDGQGALPLAPEGDAGPAWRSTRAPVGPITIRYRVPVAAANPPMRGPQFELQAAGDGISTSGLDFLVLPAGDQSYRVHLHWVLPAGRSAASSFGEGDQDFTASRQRLLDGFYTAGSLDRFAPSPTSPFQVYGLGKPGYDPAPLFAWAARWYRVSLKAFHGSPTMPFRVFYRSYDGMSAESGYSPGSVMLYLPPKPAPDSAWPARQVVAHEMVHIWVAQLDGDEGTAWYSEGAADLLSIKTPYEAGLYSPREYLKLINDRAAVYYGNARRNLSTAEVEKSMWAGADSWTTHYMRGFFYLADLDARLRARSGGKRSVIDLVNAMNDRHRRGEPIDVAAWKDLVRAELGDQAVSDFDAMMAGKTLVPMAGAFGPCLLARQTSIGVFDPGFDSTKGADGVRTVTRVAAGSNAANAGLVPGDRIVEMSDLASAYSAWDRQITLHIRRADGESVISFLPRRGSVSAVRWIPRSGDPAAPCGGSQAMRSRS